MAEVLLTVIVTVSLAMAVIHWSMARTCGRILKRLEKERHDN